MPLFRESKRQAHQEGEVPAMHEIAEPRRTKHDSDRE